MIKWTDEQRAEIWKIYVEDMMSFSVIAERYAHLGATKGSIAGLIHRMHLAREKELESDLARKKLFGERRAARKIGERRVVNLKMTKEEMARARDAQNKVRD